MTARVVVLRDEEGSNNDTSSQLPPVKDTDEPTVDWTAVSMEVWMVRAGKEFGQKTCGDHGHYFHELA